MLKGLEYLNNHISLTSSADILQICQKFFLHKDIKINHLNYIQRNYDGTVFYLCSNQNWLMHYLKMGYPSIGAFEQNKTLENFKHVLWSSLDKRDQILIDSKEILDIEHGITILDKLPIGVGFYNFGTNQHSSMLLSKYLNHLDDLHEFIFYFKETALDLLLQASKSRFILPTDTAEKKLILHTASSTIADEDNTSKKYETKIFVDVEEKNFLTAKESECVEWYFKGKTSSEIAIIMQISKRTVETHMENVKHKLKCSNMFQLGYAMAKAKHQSFGFIPQPFMIEKY
jgi:LuxR family quorum-sensing system transcriptional regulator SolR